MSNKSPNLVTLIGTESPSLFLIAMGSTGVATNYGRFASDCLLIQLLQTSQSMSV